MNKYRNVLSQALLQQHRIRLVDPLRVKSSTKVEAMDRIHVLGAGNLGIFMAHSLRKSHPELPITLMVRRSAMLKSWADFGRSIEIVTNGESEHHSNYDVEVFGKPENSPPAGRTTISNLIVATKAPSTKAAVKQVLDQLKPTSTLLFLQNGMGEFKVMILFAIIQLTEMKEPLKKLRRFSIQLRSHPFSLPSQIMACTGIAIFPRYMPELQT